MAAERMPWLPLSRRPTFIPAVSSIAKTSLAWLPHVKALVEWKVPELLVSAYDFVRADAVLRGQGIALLAEAQAAGTSILLDSGGYEARWIRDTTWSWSEYEKALTEVPHSVAFTYDLDDVKPLEAFDRASEIIGPHRLIPIIHARAESAQGVIERLVARRPAAIAVTEREAGDGLSEVAAELRRLASLLSGRVPLHLLGAGNPKSILLYAACGVDSFDGLDWCQTVADPDSVTMHHPKHLELFERPDNLMADNVSYHIRMLAHNLLFFDEWMNTIRVAVAEDRLPVLLDGLFPDSFFETAA